MNLTSFQWFQVVTTLGGIVAAVGTSYWRLSMLIAKLGEKLDAQKDLNKSEHDTFRACIGRLQDWQNGGR